MKISWRWMILSSGLAAVLLCQTCRAQVQTADWKGPPSPGEATFGGVIGMGIIDNSSGFALIGTLSKKIVKNGFVPDITNSVSVEGQLGPVFLSPGTAWFYSAHLRWDFE